MEHGSLELIASQFVFTVFEEIIPEKGFVRCYLTRLHRRPQSRRPKQQKNKHRRGDTDNRYAAAVGNSYRKSNCRSQHCSCSMCGIADTPHLQMSQQVAEREPPTEMV